MKESLLYDDNSTGECMTSHVMSELAVALSFSGLASPKQVSMSGLNFYC